MKKYLFGIAAISMAMVACTNDEALSPEDNFEEGSNQNSVVSTLKTARLTSIASSQNRVSLEPQTKAYPIPGYIELYASIENLSKNEGIDGFIKEENGRYLSATCVYYDASTETYYATYHMQGNNYNTTQENETSGFIESFKLDENGVPTLGKVISFADPDGTTMDFNHLYFDDLSNTANSSGYSGTDTGVRFIVGGHTSKGKDQKAMIGKVNFEKEIIDYTTVLTGEKIFDENGKSLGNEDAHDVNCMLRKYDFYYVATRKGLAVLNAKDDNLFSPVHNYVEIEDENGEKKTVVDENSVYFIKTPGSAKHVAHFYPSYGSGFLFFYLTQPFPENYDGNTSLEGSVVRLSMESGGGTVCGMGATGKGSAILNSKYFDITTWSLGTNQYPTGEYKVAPIDGKNVIFSLNSIEYVCMGKGGLYITNGSEVKNIKFTDAKDGNGSRPVNGVFVEDLENFNDGFIYVANGACVTILDKNTLEQVAEISLFKAGEVEDASANYIHVTKTNTYTGKCPDRLVTVAYGQEGVKIFKFVPPTR